MTQVSVEGLKKVKQALQDFKNQTALMSYTVTIIISPVKAMRRSL